MTISYYGNEWICRNNHVKRLYKTDFDDICSMVREYCCLSTTKTEHLSKFLNLLFLYVKK